MTDGGVLLTVFDHELNTLVPSYYYLDTGSK